MILLGFVDEIMAIMPCRFASQSPLLRGRFLTLSIGVGAALHLPNIPESPAELEDIELAPRMAGERPWAGQYDWRGIVNRA